jgi:hypothetical protein
MTQVPSKKGKIQVPYNQGGKIQVPIIQGFTIQLPNTESGMTQVLAARLRSFKIKAAKFSS